MKNKDVFGVKNLKMMLITTRPWLYISILFCTIRLVAGWPGWIIPDGSSMYEQAITGNIMDWHSPLLIWTWSNLAAAKYGALIPHIFSTVALWSSAAILGLIAFRFNRNPLMAIGPSLIIFCLPFFQQLNWITTDAVLAIGYLLSTSIFLLTKCKSNFSAIVVGSLIGLTTCILIGYILVG